VLSTTESEAAPDAVSSGEDAGSDDTAADPDTDDSAVESSPDESDPAQPATQAVITNTVNHLPTPGLRPIWVTVLRDSRSVNVFCEAPDRLCNRTLFAPSVIGVHVAEPETDVDVEHTTSHDCSRHTAVRGQ